MTVKYRKGRVHSNADALSRIPTQGYDDPTPEEQRTLQRVLTDAEQTFTGSVMSITAILALDDEFMTRIKDDTAKDAIYRPIVRKITKQLSTSDNASYHAFTMKDGLLYNTRKETHRLCIPRKLRKKIFDIVHDGHGHPGLKRSYGILKDNFFLPKGRSELADYILSCPACQAAKHRNHKE